MDNEPAVSFFRRHHFDCLVTNGSGKKLTNHVAAVALYVAHYNLCRTHEALRATPAKAAEKA